MFVGHQKDPDPAGPGQQELCIDTLMSIHFLIFFTQGSYIFRNMKFKTFQDLLKPCWGKFKTTLKRYVGVIYVDLTL